MLNKSIAVEVSTFVKALICNTMLLALGVLHLLVWWKKYINTQAGKQNVRAKKMDKCLSKECIHHPDGFLAFIGLESLKQVNTGVWNTD